MSDDKKKMLDTTLEVELEEGRRNGHVTSRFPMIFALVVVLAALTVTVVVVTVKSFAPNTSTSVSYKFQFGSVDDQALEEINVDQSANVVEYHVTETSPRRDDSQVWAINDFNRGIQVFKVDSKTVGTMCYVAILDQQDVLSPVNLTTTSLFTNSSSESVELHYDAVKKPIEDTSVIGPRGQLLCAGVEVRWIIPTDPSNRRDNAASSSNDVIVTYVIRHPQHARSGRQRRGLFNRRSRQRRPQSYQISVADDELMGQLFGGQTHRVNLGELGRTRDRTHIAMSASGTFRVMDRFRRRRGRRGRRPVG